MKAAEQLARIKKALLEAENPLFMFDNDIDGLVSYLLLKKFCGKGHPFIVKSSPKISETFAAKIKYYNADAVFILDKPLVEQEFLDAIPGKKFWIDHHPVQENMRGVDYFNPRMFSCTGWWSIQNFFPGIASRNS